jgi:uncharacterized protein
MIKLKQPVAFGLYDYELAGIRQVLGRYPAVAAAWVYGSRAMGTYHEGSDVDLTLEGTGLSLSDRLSVQADLHALGTLLRFDVSIRSAIANPELLAHIERVGQLIYQRQL